MEGEDFKRKFLKIFSLLSICIILVLGFDKICNVGRILLDAFSPFIIGGVFAVVLNMPMRFFENKVLKFKTKLGKKIKRPLSIIISFLIFLLVIGLVCWAIVPKLVDTFNEATKTIPSFLNNILEKIKENFELRENILKNINELQEKTESWQSLVQYISQTIPADAKQSFGMIYGLAKNIFGSIANTMIAIVFGVYTLMQKEKILSFCRKFSETFFKTKHPAVSKYLKMLHLNFENFVFGQCLECFTVAVIFTIVSGIFGFKCTLIVGIAMLFLALIPYIGNTVACGIGIILTLAMESPTRAVLFTILFIIVQTLDGYFLYPKIIGLKVSMPPILIFVASIVGGGLFGILGMVFMIPVATTLYMIIKEKIQENEKSEGKEIDII